jgi:hypothetical protein
MDAFWVRIAPRVGRRERWKRYGRQPSVLLRFPTTAARGHRNNGKAHSNDLVAGRAIIRVGRNWWVVQAKSRLTLFIRAHAQAMPFLANPNFLSDTTIGIVARNSVLFSDPLQETIDDLKSDPLPLAIALQLHDFFHCARVRAGSLGMIVVVHGEHLRDL